MGVVAHRRGRTGHPLVLTAMPEFGMFAVGAVAAAVTAALGGEQSRRSWSS